MTKMTFTTNDEPTVGVEIELALVDGESMALSSSIGRVLETLGEGAAESFKPELMQCCVEINTCVCRNIAEVETDLRAKLRLLEAATDKLGLRLFWGATHPFSNWREQQVTPTERYHNLVAALQEMARRLVTFGLHVHVGVDSGDKAVMICDRIMQHLPTLLALSCNSPYWQRRDTGLQSHRSKIMEGLPTAGLPPLMRNWSEYVWLVRHMVDTGFIQTIREIWWDVRPHHNFGTVEVRMCDMPGSLDDVLSLAALTQCLVRALSDAIDEGAYQHDCHPMMVRQNKWRASRFGPAARLVNAYTHKIQSLDEVVGGLLERLRPVADELDCRVYLDRVEAMARGASWSDRQRGVFQEAGDAAEVVRRLTAASRISALGDGT